MQPLKILFCFLLLIGCHPKTPQKTKHLVLVSIAPYAYLVEKIVGNSVQVKTLAPPYANPHTYEPSPKEMSGINNAAIWFCIGEHFEKKALPALKSHNQKLTVINLLDSLNLAANEKDRHVWLSPKLTQKQAAIITSSLCQAFPELAAIFRSNLEKLLASLDELDRHMHTILDAAENKTILVSHAAFKHLCQEYGLAQLSLESEGKEPTAKILGSLLEKIGCLRIKAIFIHPQHSTKGAALISDKLKLPMLPIDPYAYDYEKNMLEIAWQIANVENHVH